MGLAARIPVALRWLGAWTLITGVLLSAGDRVFKLVTINEAGIHMYDFPYYLIIARGFWFQGFPDIYSGAQILAILTDYLGVAPNTILPVALTPTSILVMLPFCLLSLWSLMLAHSAWVATSVVAAAYAFTLLVRGEPAIAGRQRLGLVVVLGLAAASLTGLTTLLIGQNSLLAVAALTILIAECWHAEREGAETRMRVYLPCMLLLSIKPPYFVFGTGLLLIKGHWRAALTSASLVVAELLLFTLVVGVEWLRSYGEMLRIYSQAEIPDQYRLLGLVFESMNIFRTAFDGYAPPAVLVRLGEVILGVVFTGVFGWSLFRVAAPGVARQIGLNHEQLYALLIGAYLLFAPHAGFYEDLLLLTLWAMAARYECLPPLASAGFMALAICGWTTFNFFLAESPPARTAMWCAKLAEVALFMMVLQRRPNSVPETTAVAQ